MSRPRLSHRLSSRLLATAAIALFGTTASIALLLFGVTRWEPEIMIRQELKLNAERVGEQIQFDSNGVIRPIVLPDLMQTAYDSLQNDYAYRLLDAAGNVTLSSDGKDSPFTRAGQPFSPKETRLDLFRHGLLEHVLTQKLERADKTYYLQVMRSDRLIQALAGSAREQTRLITIAAVFIPMLIFAIVVIVTMAGVLRSLRLISFSAARIGPGNLAERLSGKGLPAELTPLIDAFNQTLERLEKGFQIQREFLATVAHELKTPLALMRVHIEVKQMNDQEVLLQDIDHMSRQVHQLLHLAEVSERQNYKFVACNIAFIIDEVLANLQRLAAPKNIALIHPFERAQPLVMCDSGAVFILLRNLIENAIHHAPPDSAITITANAGKIVVQDQGPGIAAEMKRHIFKRFWRGAYRRDSGAGLGLSICQEITDAHAWKIAVENNHPGARFSILF